MGCKLQTPALFAVYYNKNINILKILLLGSKRNLDPNHHLFDKLFFKKKRRNFYGLQILKKDKMDG